MTAAEANWRALAFAFPVMVLLLVPYIWLWPEQFSSEAIAGLVKVHGVRLLFRFPGVTIAALLALALGTGVNTALYSSEALRQQGDILLGATTFRFDASDLMPAEVGAGTFWTGMVDWTTGRKSTEEVTADIESSWPSG